MPIFFCGEFPEKPCCALRGGAATLASVTLHFDTKSSKEDQDHLWTILLTLGPKGLNDYCPDLLWIFSFEGTP